MGFSRFASFCMRLSYVYPFSEVRCWCHDPLNTGMSIRLFELGTVGHIPTFYVFLAPSLRRLPLGFQFTDSLQTHSIGHSILMSLQSVSASTALLTLGFLTIERITFHVSQPVWFFFILEVVIERSLEDLHSDGQVDRYTCWVLWIINPYC